MVDAQTPFTIKKRAKAERSERKRLQVKSRKQAHNKRRIKPYDIKVKNNPMLIKERTKRGKLMPEDLM